MGGNGDMQFRLRVGLSHHPERGQQMDGVAQKAKIKHHDLAGVACPRKKNGRNGIFSHES